MRAWLAGLAVALAAAGAASAGDYHAPRNGYGAPDFDGMWNTSSLTEMERPDAFKTLVASETEAATFEKAHRSKPPDFGPDDTVGGAESEWWERDVGLARIRGQIRTSWIFSPPDGQYPTRPEAKAFYKARSEARKANFDDPEGRSLSERCIDPVTPPMYNIGQGDFFQAVQTRDQIAFLSEWDHTLRIVRLGKGARHPAPDQRQWRGDSIGWFEGETLVVETTNFMPAEVDDPARDPKADIRLVERMTRISPTDMLYEFVISNPAVQIQDVRGEMLAHVSTKPIYESACHEGNYGLVGILSGARQQELTAKK